MDGGLAHGVTAGAEFTIYPDQESVSRSRPLGLLTVDLPTSFYSTMSAPSNEIPLVLPAPAVAVQTGTGGRKDLRLYVPSDDAFLPFYTSLESLLQDDEYQFRNIELVSSASDSDLEVVRDGDSYALAYHDERITRHGLQRLFHRVNATVEDMVPFLKAASHYFWELNRTTNNPTVTNGVRLEIFKLTESQFEFDGFGRPEMAPTGPNLFDGTTFDFVVEEDVPYGIRLTNDTPYDLFPNLFYFDNSDLSIGKWFTVYKVYVESERYVMAGSYYQSPPSNGAYVPDVPLKKNGGVLTIGYGSSGAPPFSYFLRDEQDIDVGFLKLFLSSKPVDLSNIPQQSPFDGATRDGVDPEKDNAETWGTIFLPVIQRRYPAPVLQSSQGPFC